ncbi:hypothetical protein pipiens_017451 [Culex pipiens pipiens]|uniref:Glycosyltransferase 2-like domain-containing protein n=1 Tax=Culex pipiens pipiens TaxID=38569 RepID=A0ABD1CGJ8_CULPP
MGLIGRRRSSFLKIIALLGVVWFMVVFVLYSDDGSSSSSRSAGGVAGPSGGGSAFEAPRRLPLQGIRDRFNQFIINAREDANKDDLSPDVDGGEGGAGGVVDYVNNNIDGDVPFVEKETKRKVPPKSKKRNENQDLTGVIAPPNEDSPDAPGAMGKPVVLPKDMSPEMKKAVDDGWAKNAFNQYAADMISIRRSLPDPRDPWCKEPNRYQKDLPATSVIICFHNEAWSVLLRTVHSVLDRSPEHLVKEVILVDDFSDMRK